METIAIVTKGTTNADLPYIDEQRFYFRRRGKDAFVLVNLGVSGAVAGNQSEVTIVGGEFFASTTGASLGTTLTLTAGYKLLFVKIYKDRAYFRCRNGIVITSLGSSVNPLYAICEGIAADDMQSPYMELYLNDLSPNTTGLIMYSNSGNTSTIAASVPIGDINLLADYPLVYCSLEARSENGLFPLANITGELKSPMNSTLSQFSLFPNFRSRGFEYNECSVDISAFANTTAMQICEINCVPVKGNISVFANKPSLQTVVLDRQNNEVVGSLTAFTGKNSLITLRIQSSLLTGSLNALPSSVEIIHLMSLTSLDAYTSRSWGTRMQSVQLSNLAWKSSTELGIFLNDLTTITTWAGWKNVIVKGSLDAIGIAAIATLQGKGVAVTIINP